MNKIISIAILFCFFFSGAYAQSGAKLSFGVSSMNQDFLNTDQHFTGYNIRLAARLGAKFWFFSPEINYSNYNVIGSNTQNPFEKNARIQAMKIPVGLGWKVRITPFQRIFVKGGLIGTYILSIDENAEHDFSTIKDVYGGYYGALGYDLYWFTIDYRYEKSLVDNYFNIADSKIGIHTISMGINF